MSTDLIGELVGLREEMNRGLKGIIRHERTLPSGEVRFLVEVIEGAATGSLIDLTIDQFAILHIEEKRNNEER